jgi:hypothetical protein
VTSDISLLLIIVFFCYYDKFLGFPKACIPAGRSGKLQARQGARAQAVADDRSISAGLELPHTKSLTIPYVSARNLIAIVFGLTWIGAP